MDEFLFKYKERFSVTQNSEGIKENVDKSDHINICIVKNTIK